MSKKLRMKNSPNTIIRISICLGMSLCGLALAADDKKEAARKAALEAADKKALAENMMAYKEEVRPFLEKHCIGCHGPKKLKGDLALDLLDPDMKESTSAARWAVVRDQLENLSLIHI